MGGPERCKTWLFSFQVYSLEKKGFSHRNSIFKHSYLFPPCPIDLLVKVSHSFSEMLICSQKSPGEHPTALIPALQKHPTKRLSQGGSIAQTADPLHPKMQRCQIQFLAHRGQSPPQCRPAWCCSREVALGHSSHPSALPRGPGMPSSTQGRSGRGHSNNCPASDSGSAVGLYWC